MFFLLILSPLVFSNIESKIELLFAVAYSNNKYPTGLVLACLVTTVLIKKA